MSQTRPTPGFSSRIAYKDQGSAVEWLERAFGFVTTTLAKGADGKVVYAEMAFGNGLIQIGSEWENIKAPGSLSGANTQTITAHWRRGLTNTANALVRLAAKYSRSLRSIPRGSHLSGYGPEGHVWSISQKLRAVKVEEMEAAIPGMKVWKR